MKRFTSAFERLLSKHLAQPHQFKLLAGAVLVVLPLAIPLFSTWKEILASQQNTLSQLPGFNAALHMPGSGRDVLSDSVQDSLHLLTSNRVKSYAISHGMEISSDEYKQRITESAWPIRFLEKPQSRHYQLISQFELNLLKNCRPVEKGREVILAICN